MLWRKPEFAKPRGNAAELHKTHIKRRNSFSFPFIFFSESRVIKWLGRNLAPLPPGVRRPLRNIAATILEFRTERLDRLGPRSLQRPPAIPREARWAGRIQRTGQLDGLRHDKRTYIEHVRNDCNKYRDPRRRNRAVGVAGRMVHLDEARRRQGPWNAFSQCEESPGLGAGFGKHPRRPLRVARRASNPGSWVDPRERRSAACD